MDQSKRVIIVVYSERKTNPIMKKNILVVVVMLFSMTAIYASFPVKKKAVKSSNNQAQIEMPSSKLSEMQGVESNSLIFAVPVVKEIKTPKKERWAFTRAIMQKLTYPETTSNGWGIASFCCAMVGLFFPPMGILAIIFGAIGVNKKLKGLAIAGLTLGVIEILVIVAYLFFIITIFG